MIDVKKVEEAIFSQKYKALLRILQLDKGSPYSSLQKNDFPVLESCGIPVDDYHVHIAIFCDLYRMNKVCKKTTMMDVVIGGQCQQKLCDDPVFCELVSYETK